MAGVEKSSLLSIVGFMVRLALIALPYNWQSTNNRHRSRAQMRKCFPYH